MSNLSTLLNPASPAPPADFQSPIIINPAIGAGGIATDYREGHDNMRPANIYTGGSPRRPSLTSPLTSPLDALAEAATSSAPLPSPSRPAHSSISYDMHHPNLPTSSSRPTSSHTSPPRSFELPRPQQSMGQFSPGLEQYHHSSSNGVNARRISDINTSSEVLPPLRRSLADENIPPTKGLPAVEPHTENDINGSGCTVPAPLPASPPTEPARPLPEPLSPVTAQIRQPSPSVIRPSHSPEIPEKQAEQVQVKAEMAEVPLELCEVSSQRDATTVDGATDALEPSSLGGEAPMTSKAVADLKNDASYKPSPTTTMTEPSTRSPSAKPKQAPSKKRPAPKKGTASAKKPPSKKRKIENDSIASSPAWPRTGTPASSRASRTPAPKGGQQGSVTPARSSSVANAKDEDEDEEMDEGDSSELFCICRKPDDHTWMIGCDGPCEDWFHGRCVDMSERDGKLIDKYFCPNCTEASVGQTLWKRMCRLETCREPARASGPKPSKYCSDEHGIEFMRQRALKGEPDATGPKIPTSPATGRRRSRKDNYTDNICPSSDHLIYEPEPDDDANLRGGVLRPAELKTLASTAKSITEFRSLGEGVLSPPDTASPEEPTYTPAEAVQLATITTRTDALKQRKQLLDDRDTFLSLVKARAKAALDDLKKKGEKIAGVCGFDARLAFTDEEFAAWRSSSEGQETFRTGQLVASTTASAEMDASVVVGSEGEPTLTNGVKEEEQKIEEGVCTKKRCKRHEMWQKLQMQEVAFEKDLVRQEMRRLIAEEKGIKERAAVRSLEE